MSAGSSSTTPLPITRPSFGPEEEAASLRVLRSGWVTQGPEVARFEEEFAAAVGAPFACAVSSCTAALHLALHALDIGPGDEVVTVSHSFIATANAVWMTGATPVFVDIDPGNYNLDPALLESAVTERTRALVVVHQLGMPCDLARVLAFADARGLPVVEDAACAAGSEIDLGQGFERVGAPRGLIACFSFHPRKVITTGDGGMLTCRDPALDRRFRLLRQHGMAVSDVERHQAKQVTLSGYVEPGFNYRMTDLQAAVGRVQLSRLAGLVRRRRELAERYRARLPDVGLVAPEEPAWARSNWQSYAVRLRPEHDRDALMQALLDEQIASRPGVMCAHQEPAYQGRPFWRQASPLVESERATAESVLLPLFPEMDDRDVDRVVAALGKALGAR